MIYTILYLLVGVIFNSFAYRLGWFEDFHESNDGRQHAPLGPLGIGVCSIFWPAVSVLVGLYYVFVGLGNLIIFLGKK